MTRAILIVLDSVGCGGAQDADDFGDAGADTLGHIAAACALGQADRPGLREGPLNLPNLAALGLGHACRASTGLVPPGLPVGEPPLGIATCAREISPGKDTPTGHWEMAGSPYLEKLTRFPNTQPCLPTDFVAHLAALCALPGILGDCHADGIGIIDRFGEEHLATLKPIVYTSSDSVLQIAAHEQAFGLERLYEVCRAARKLADSLNVGRVIARPFLGSSRHDFLRTPHRKDFPIPAPAGNLLDAAHEAGREIVTLGKVGDIFGHRATGREIKGASNAALLDVLEQVFPAMADGSLLFANLVDFDTDYGHRRDAAGYAAALEAFDARLPAIQAMLRPGDLVTLSADHGNDPTAPGGEHTRENVPVLCFGPGIAGRALPPRETFADIGQTTAGHLRLAPVATGKSFL